MNNNVVIEAVDVVKALGEGAGRVMALKGVSIAVAGGELTLLMGPSGSGKTTLLSILGCLLSPTQGLVKIRERTVTGAGAEELAKLRRENIGFIFQSYHLFPTLMAEENVRLPLDVRGERTRAALIKAREALVAVGLSHKFKSFPRDLSGGEQQRVAIARAIVSDPNLLLCDEPTGDLDRQSADEILSILQLLNGELGKTIVMVTHDPAAANYAKRVLHLDKGRFVERELAA